MNYSESSISCIKLPRKLALHWNSHSQSLCTTTRGSVQWRFPAIWVAILRQTACDLDKPALGHRNKTHQLAKSVIVRNSNPVGPGQPSQNWVNATDLAVTNAFAFKVGNPHRTSLLFHQKGNKEKNILKKNVVFTLTGHVMVGSFAVSGAVSRTAEHDQPTNKRNGTPWGESPLHDGQVLKWPWTTTTTMVDMHEARSWEAVVHDDGTNLERSLIAV